MRRRMAIVAALPMLLAAACGTAQKTASSASPAPSSASSAPASAAPSAVPTGPRAAAADLKVTGKIGKKPKVTFPDGLPPLTSASKKVVEGAGAAAKDGDVLTASVTVWNWDGKKNESPGSDYDQGHAEFVTVSPQLPKALHEALVGAKPGARVFAVVAKDNLTADQLTQAKQQGTDFDASAQVLVVDVIAAAPKAAHGTATDPHLDGVTLTNPGGDAAPTLTTKTDAKPSAKLVTKTVIKGHGPKVKGDQTVLVHYVGKVWGTDKTFDSSWQRGAPASFPLNGVVKGWSEGLSGVPVGSRVLLTIPPDLGYGKEGNPDAGITGTDTLVFVVDVLAAA